MAQWVKALAAKPEDLNSVPETHTWWKENDTGWPRASTCVLRQVHTTHTGVINVVSGLFVCLFFNLSDTESCIVAQAGLKCVSFCLSILNSWDC